MKTRTWLDPVFGSHFVIMWDGTPEQFSRVIKQYYDASYDGEGDYVGRCWDTDAPACHTVIIMLPQWRRSAHNISILVHECFHATERALLFRDIEHSAETSEVFAYFLDHLVERCLNILP